VAARQAAIFSPPINHLRPPIDHALSEELGLFGATGAGVRRPFRAMRSISAKGTVVGDEAEYPCDFAPAQRGCHAHCRARYGRSGRRIECTGRRSAGGVTSGFYVGGHVGGGFADSSWNDPFTGGSNNFNKGGFIGGGQIGFNTQFDRLVLGLEGDFSWTGIKNHSTDSLGDALTANTQWTSTVTGRIGAAFDRLLVYSKGGLAIAREHDSLTDLALNTSSTTLTRTGWTAGAGLEYALNRNWSVRVEYDYLGFGSKPLNFTTPLLGSVTPTASLNVQEVKAGLNFKFGN
jgi:outer membrane immunogenic protein